MPNKRPSLYSSTKKKRSQSRSAYLQTGGKVSQKQASVYKIQEGSVPPEEEDCCRKRDKDVYQPESFRWSSNAIPIEVFLVVGGIVRPGLESRNQLNATSFSGKTRFLGYPPGQLLFPFTFTLPLHPRGESEICTLPLLGPSLLNSLLFLRFVRFPPLLSYLSVWPVTLGSNFEFRLS